MKKVIITILITLAVPVIIILVYIYSGAYNVSQLSSHKGITEWAVETTMERSVEKRSDGIVLPENLIDSLNLTTGFNHYNEMCIGCHGAPGMDPAEVVKGLYPEPPLLHNLQEAENDNETNEETDEETREFFWIIKNGVRMTAMPAFGPTHSDQKIWAITAFVSHTLPDLSAQDFKLWKEKYGKNEMEEGEGEHQHEHEN